MTLQHLGGYGSGARADEGIENDVARARAQGDEIGYELETFYCGMDVASSL